MSCFQKTMSLKEMSLWLNRQAQPHSVTVALKTNPQNFKTPNQSGRYLLAPLFSTNMTTSQRKCLSSGAGINELWSYFKGQNERVRRREAKRLHRVLLWGTNGYTLFSCEGHVIRQRLWLLTKVCKTWWRWKWWRRRIWGEDDDEDYEGDKTTQNMKKMATLFVIT